jgi:hypothetical protein
VGAPANFTLALEILLGKDAVGPSFYSGTVLRAHALSALDSEEEGVARKGIGNYTSYRDALSGHPGVGGDCHI